MTTISKFDDFASSYDKALAQGLAVSGENKEYFARHRIEWLKHCLDRLREEPRTAMEFGCGSGSTVPILLELLGIRSAVGVDVSAGLLDLAQKAFGSERACFLQLTEYQPNGENDLVYCNGVFHHIPPQERAEAVAYVSRCLRPGGVFALWENNPWNPGTRYVMKRIPFDADAVTLNCLEVRRLLTAAGLEIARTDFHFIFPRMLGWLRGLEPLVSRLPIGAQYQVLARKPRAV